MRSLKIALAVSMAAALTVGLVGCGESSTGTIVETEIETVYETETETSDFSFDELAGSYMDQYSGRATAELISYGDSASVRIDWASSAFEYTEWTMTVTYDDGKLVYSDCSQVNYTSSEDGEEETETVYENGSGYFEWDAENLILAWTGAEDENCVDCEFAYASGPQYSDEYYEMASVLADIYAIQPGSSGSSLRAEEAAASVESYLETYGADFTVSDYLDLTNIWLMNMMEDDSSAPQTLSDSMEDLNAVESLQSVSGYDNFYEGVSDSIIANMH